MATTFAHEQPSADDLQRAFDYCRGEGWPKSLLELSIAVSRYGEVRAVARRIAKGECLADKPDLAGPLKPHTAPPRPASRPFPTRHGDAGAVDLKRRAAGDDSDEEEA